MWTMKLMDGSFDKMKRIPLSQGKFAIVDDDDFERCSQFKWHISGQRYVMRHIRKSDGSRTCQYLARFIMNEPDGLEVDHRHGNKLDHRKSELRVCTHYQNCCNKRKYKNNTSGVKGVSWDNDALKWRARIRVNGKLIGLGRFDDIMDASDAYDVASPKYHGEFGRINDFV